MLRESTLRFTSKQDLLGLLHQYCLYHQFRNPSGVFSFFNRYFFIFFSKKTDIRSCFAVKRNCERLLRFFLLLFVRSLFHVEHKALIFLLLT